MAFIAYEHVDTSAFDNRRQAQVYLYYRFDLFLVLFAMNYVIWQHRRRRTKAEVLSTKRTNHILRTSNHNDVHDPALKKILIHLFDEPDS